MHRRLIYRLWLVFVVVVCTGTTAASTPTACAEAHCVYLPLVSTPGLISISNVRLQGTRFPAIAILGEVNAVTSTPVYSVTLEVRIYDQEGQLVRTEEGRPALTATLPGQPNPFYFFSGFMDEDDYDYNNYDLRIKSASLTSPRSILPVMVDVASAECEGYSSFRVEGTLTNQNDKPLDDVRAVLWDSSLSYGLFPRQFAAHLEPFEAVPFSTSIPVENCGALGSVVSYKIAAQGVVP